MPTKNKTAFYTAKHFFDSPKNTPFFQVFAGVSETALACTQIRAFI